MTTWRIPYNHPFFGATERVNLEQVLLSGHVYGDGAFTKQAEHLLQTLTGSPHVLLTGSCTSALELAALLADIRQGDEVIMPSWTFASTANAFVLRHAIPVFVDVCPATLTLDLKAVESAMTSRTRAVVAVNYAGFGPDMETLVAMCQQHALVLIEDAAQAAGACRNGVHYGTFGQFGCLSFHGTKNIVAGEAGALLLNDKALALRAEIVREKGTDRSRFLRGEVDKYTWRECGSSYLPSEFAAAILCAQLESEQTINDKRRTIWQRYQNGLSELARQGCIRIAQPDSSDTGNGHIYWLMCEDLVTRQTLLRNLAAVGIQAVTHYIPLHDSPAGIRFGRSSGRMKVTDDAANTLVRLPIWPDMSPEQTDDVIQTVIDFFRRAKAGTV